jgi:ubiquinone/menaquinone biosynthesis C-methylase UbiE
VLQNIDYGTSNAVKRSASSMPQVHFVEDYERHVVELMASHPLDEAMSLAVGGKYDEIGGLTADILEGLRLRDGMSLVDLGCGSGRTAKYLGLRYPNLSYIGIDIVQSLLDYAQKQCPAHFRFIKHHEVSIPVEAESADFLVAFSVFTHLLHEETYLYMSEAKRVLVTGGKLIFSFLEFAAPHHWNIFEQTIAVRRQHTRYPMNMFIEQHVIKLWADKIGLHVESIGHCPLGQSLAVLRRLH